MATKKSGQKIKLISAHAKKIWKKDKEKWTDAIKRATVELRENKKL